MVRSEFAPVQRQDQPLPSNLQRQTPCDCGCEGGRLRTRQGKTFEVCLSRGLGLQELLVQVPLPPAQKHLLRVFYDHERGKGTCFVSVARLMMATGLKSRQSVFTHAGELKRLGVVKSQAPGGGNPHRCNVYSLHWEALLSLGLTPEPSRPRRVRARSALGTSAVVPAVTTGTSEDSHREERCANEALPGDETSFDELPAQEVPVMGLPGELPAVVVQPKEAHKSDEGWLELPEGELLEPGEELANFDVEGSAEALFGEALSDLPLREPEAISAVLPPVVLVDLGEEVAPQEEPRFAGAQEDAPQVGQVDPSPVPETSSSSSSSPAASQEVASAGSFQVSFSLLWKFWREAYLAVYGRAYLDSLADRRMVPMLASACSAAVTHRLAIEPSASPSLLVEQFLKHVFKAYLRRPGRNNFLQERGHPLGLLLQDLNALGTPWGKGPPPARPLEVATPPKFLEPEENVQHIRNLLEGLKKKPESGQPSAPRPGGPRRKS